VVEVVHLRALPDVKGTEKRRKEGNLSIVDSP